MAKNYLAENVEQLHAEVVALQLLFIGVAKTLKAHGFGEHLLNEAFEIADNAAIGGAGRESVPGAPQHGTNILQVLESLRKSCLG